MLPGTRHLLCALLACVVVTATLSNTQICTGVTCDVTDPYACRTNGGYTPAVSYTCCGAAGCQPIPIVAAGQPCGDGCNPATNNTALGSCEDGAICYEGFCKSTYVLGCPCTTDGECSAAAGQLAYCRQGYCAMGSVKPAFPCYYDDQCYGTAAGRCASGVCQVPQAQSQGDCYAGFGICPEGQYCEYIFGSNWQCRNKSAPGALCFSNSNYPQYTNAGSNSACVYKTQGGPIVPMKSCTTGYACVSGNCVASAAGSACTSDWECAEGFACASSKCVAMCSLPDMTPCGGDDNNCGAVCSSGYALNFPGNIVRCAPYDVDSTVTYSPVKILGGPLGESGARCGYADAPPCDVITHAFDECGGNVNTCNLMDGVNCENNQDCGDGVCTCNKPVGLYQCSVNPAAICQSKIYTVTPNMQAWMNLGGAAVKSAATIGQAINTQPLSAELAASMADIMCCQQCFVVPAQSALSGHLVTPISGWDFGVNQLLQYYTVDCSTMQLTKIATPGAACALTQPPQGFATNCDAYKAAQLKPLATNAAAHVLPSMVTLALACLLAIDLINGTLSRLFRV